MNTTEFENELARDGYAAVVTEGINGRATGAGART